MTRSEFDLGVQHLANSTSSTIPKAQVLDTWYARMRDTSTWAWKIAIAKAADELDMFPRNLPHTLAGYLPPPRRTDLDIPINPDTGRPYTPDDCDRNLRRLKALVNVVWDREHPAHKTILACAAASATEGDSLQARQKWGAHILRELDQVLP